MATCASNQDTLEELESEELDSEDKVEESRNTDQDLKDDHKVTI